ncbi:hypothetical protein [Xanthomonas campestris]|uniref:hypothetical protein n=3 Tax=Xanthomonas campestris TaxID=339 RepID=UPI002379307A|nr:hypothetical protein [Xanthomonas campestris]MEA9561660.1 hypothetical protein [Xanthomonas campestris]MEA9721337.1 hypothetical protein [Xanthomonas campestris]MEB1883278.1 hypothetical protein [Xanthomonas campestris pv. campestris]WDL18986.1 hypothetical protein JH285_06975 [Xanthomonas campestris pv. campestris]WDL23070.1 hypothetical protein JH268_07025 [Xanthomonas campestris pv. campestris]
MGFVRVATAHEDLGFAVSADVYVRGSNVINARPKRRMEQCFGRRRCGIADTGNIGHPCRALMSSNKAAFSPDPPPLLIKLAPHGNPRCCHCITAPMQTPINDNGARFPLAPLFFAV